MVIANYLHDTPKKKLLFGCIFLSSLIITACQDSRPAYIHAIPDFDQYKYFTVDNWNGISKDTLVAKTWYNPSNSSISIGRVSGILAIDTKTYWISDFMKGSIIELDQNGLPIKKVFSSGRGPSEFLRPISMAMDLNDRSRSIYIMDHDQKMIVKSSLYGIELNRYFYKYMPNSFGHNKLKVISHNEFIWPTYNQGYVLSMRDTSDNIVEQYVMPIIPLGYHPTMHNNIAYDIVGDTLVYAYHGIPIVFVTTNDQKFIVNLDPEKEFKEIENPSNSPPSFESATVSGLIKDVFYVSETTWVAYKNSLVQIPLERDKAIIFFGFKDEDGHPVVYHSVFFTGNTLFLVNRQSGIIYKSEIGSIR